MATKKQKRLAAQAKREAFMEVYRKDGLAALERAHQEENRAKRLERLSNQFCPLSHFEE
jgi:hypothetical protein